MVGEGFIVVAERCTVLSRGYILVAEPSSAVAEHHVVLAKSPSSWRTRTPMSPEGTASKCRQTKRLKAAPCTACDALHPLRWRLSKARTMLRSRHQAIRILSQGSMRRHPILVSRDARDVLGAVRTEPCSWPRLLRVGSDRKGQAK